MNKFWTPEAIDRALANYESRIRSLTRLRDFYDRELKRMIEHPERKELLALRSKNNNE